MTTLVNDAPAVQVVIEQRAPLVLTPTSNTGPGAGGGDVGTVLMFNSPALQWIINHNLGRKVAVALFTTGGVQFNAETVTVSDNQVVSSFSIPTAGYARVI